ncbi:cell division ATP-binding protein FtsE [Phytohabitans aurantiacus]|uniref:Cell division ATP-binding protein FtsE n=1 Tax=Phytohabitans aurantiacus TaxID=3016789 RepID=A0ABQ5R164_9ACTN|nr:ATP-binding cassette domain-containing protein [Phytohabitans aurantiacus]GLH99927.1 cell division ATP-binding protein FtsE [Phytohabitans aurantiacus]
MITLTQVTKVYQGARRPALHQVTATIEKGEFVFVVGEAGSGKSTLLKLVLKEVRPTLGTVTVNGRNLESLPRWKEPHFRRSIGYVPQRPLLIARHTVYENVAHALRVIGKTEAVCRRVVPEILELVGLGMKENRYPHELSAGEQQRVAVARSFANRPLVILADEPSSAVDPDTTIELMRLMDRINRTGTTLMVASTDAKLVSAMRRRVLEFEEGSLIRDQVRGVWRP